MQILYMIFIYFLPILDVNGVPKLLTLVYPLMFKANNSIIYGKLNYYNPQNVVKLTDNKFKNPWKNIVGRKQAAITPRTTPTPTMTKINLLSGFMEKNQYTTRISIEEPIPIMEYPEPITKIQRNANRIGAAGETIGELLWGYKNSMSLPLNERNTFIPLTTSTPIEKPIPIIEYSEPIIKIQRGEKGSDAAGKTIGELLWGNKNSISLPFNERNTIVPFTINTPIEEPIPIIEYPEPIIKIQREEKRKTIGELLWGNKNTINLPLNEQNTVVPPHVIKSKHHEDIYTINKLTEHGNVQQYNSLINPGYDYDDTICKLVNQRILCGYNKNVGTIDDETAYIKLKGDCRLRNDRIECGYSRGTINLNNDQPYLNNGFRTRPDQSRSDSTPLPPTNNRGYLDMVAKLATRYDSYQNIPSSNLRNEKYIFTEYIKKITPEYWISLKSVY